MIRILYVSFILLSTILYSCNLDRVEIDEVVNPVDTVQVTFQRGIALSDYHVGKSLYSFPSGEILIAGESNKDNFPQLFTLALGDDGIANSGNGFNYFNEVSNNQWLYGGFLCNSENQVGLLSHAYQFNISKANSSMYFGSVNSLGQESNISPHLYNEYFLPASISAAKSGGWIVSGKVGPLMLINSQVALLKLNLDGIFTNPFPKYFVLDDYTFYGSYAYEMESGDIIGIWDSDLTGVEARTVIYKFDTQGNVLTGFPKIPSDLYGLYLSKAIPLISGEFLLWLVDQTSSGKFVIAKVNSSGNIVSGSINFLNSLGFDYVHDIIQTSQGNVAIIGSKSSGSNNYEIVFEMLDDSGNEVAGFPKLFNMDGTSVMGSALSEASDGGYLLVGRFTDPNIGLVIIKTDENGVVD